ncbi:hypothetical protein PQE71_gp076 [Bacillus phage Izhevsk]|uniref:Uncharacterized protein n=2 Tax=Tsamsavirus TaxID=3044849 RepID=A0A6H0X620_9CAUD|nr:hypothetical protein X915_gp091 [Bacillus phage vB_BanS-Tsamsa]YP_010680481.1 hypothetical protein PQE71_gp076 [Bacillus phage Izhevsk]AGI11827.1 hypothetical protein [Bacillus phage vB_BanS-Tsamsa]QIW89758.1 hypothetical protein Izhevsk_77 [Bacillus phage Izhevsk]
MSAILKHELEKYSGKRKHSSQMKKFENTGLMKRLKEVEEWEWELIDHALDRLIEKGIRASKRDIVSTIYNCSIIEYRIVYNRRLRLYEERVILRSKATVNRCYNLNVVFSLTTKNIVTVWINHVKDRHSTLDWSIYDKNMKVLGV